MKWKATWWGVQIIADTKEDQELLDKLKSTLSKQPIESYEDGELETPEKNILEFNR